MDSSSKISTRPLPSIRAKSKQNPNTGGQKSDGIIRGELASSYHTSPIRGTERPRWVASASKSKSQPLPGILKANSKPKKSAGSHRVDQLPRSDTPAAYEASRTSTPFPYNGTKSKVNAKVPSKKNNKIKGYI